MTRVRSSPGGGAAYGGGGRSRPLESVADFSGPVRGRGTASVILVAPPPMAVIWARVVMGLLRVLVRYVLFASATS